MHSVMSGPQMWRHAGLFAVIWLLPPEPCKAASATNSLIRRESTEKPLSPFHVSNGRRTHSTASGRQPHSSWQARHTAYTKARRADRPWRKRRGVRARKVLDRRDLIRLRTRRLLGTPSRSSEPPKYAKPNLTACHSHGRWPELHEFDLMISWYSGRPQSNITSRPSDSVSLLQEADQDSNINIAAVDNQAEIKYALRSFEQFGLMKHVRNVVILMDSWVLAKHGAPRFFDYSIPNLRIVTDKDLGVNNTGCRGCGKWSKLMAAHTIPGLSEYFLWLPDDVFLMKKAQLDHWYNKKLRKPRMYTYGTFKIGWCDNHDPVGSLHGPVLINKCVMEKVAHTYEKEGFNKVHNGRLSANRSLDVLCLYSNAVDGLWDWPGFDRQFMKECHTNSRGPCMEWGTKPVFINLQGNAVSDEYSSKLNGPAETWMKRFMPHGAHRWLEEHFPNPSRFETKAEATAATLRAP
mmetsp:Transcript_75214/g.141935  ORF Transcript_75214/g.141935 Transcript_75214/m.141935 type:complete len:463 (+) Transcript_75214:121-1509(+)